MSNSTIAVLGMGCVYPGALSPETLWENVLAGRRYFRKTPDERLPSKDYFDPDPAAPNKTYCDRMALIDGWSFDPTQWKIPPITYNQSDIVHWLALDTAKQALQDARIDFAKTDRRRVGVVIGNSGAGEFHRSYLMPNRWPFMERTIRRAVTEALGPEDAEKLVEAVRHYHQSPFPEIREDYLAGIMGNVIAGRIANYFDFHSAAYIVDGACASSLLAVIHACSHLESGDMELVICGGVDVSLDPLEMVGFAKTQALAKEDIRPYDERAAGIQLGEGCGLLVLATEAYARQQGYPIRALIKGWGISADGSGGITQPKVEGQRLAIEKAYEKAGYSIANLGYIEGHGTGTPVGDRVEITALKGLLDEAGATSTCHIGSLKANIGHTKAASGVAGMIKAIFALERKVLPPHLNWKNPHPAFGSPLTNLRPSVGGPWESDAPRRAGVSGFGFGGTNTHITLEEAEHETRPHIEDIQLIGSQQSSELLLFSADSAEELRLEALRLTALARRICQAELTDLSAELTRRPHTAPYRAAIVSETPWQLAVQLTRLIEGLDQGRTLEELDAPSDGLFLAEVKAHPRLALLFPGQGSQRINMGRRLVERFPVARELFQQFDEEMHRATGQTLGTQLFRDIWEADDPTRQDWEASLRDTRLQQPAVTACSLIGLKLLDHLGLRPEYATGHSLGEIGALTSAGALRPEDAFRLAVIRGRAMHDIVTEQKGGMAAIGSDSKSLQRLIEAQGLDLLISNFNSPRQQVVSGPLQEIERLLRICQDANIWARRLPVSHAFHSPAVASAAQALDEGLKAITLSGMSRATVFATSTGNRLTPDTDLRDLLTRQIQRPVRFVEAIQGIAAENPDLWIELGPGQVLTQLTRDTLMGQQIECFPTDLPGEDGLHLLNRLLARAFVLGFPLRTERLFDGRFHRPFDTQHYDPKLIINPCERPVEPPTEPLRFSGLGLATRLMPADADTASFQSYLTERGDFLKQYVELDYRNWPGRTAIQKPAPAALESAPVTTPAEPEPEVTERPVQDLVIDWIVERTGYPREFVTPDKRLRDDLNLDSIKAGELALMLSKQLKQELPVDLGLVANASIDYLVNSLLEFDGQRISTDPSLSGGWIKTFGLAAEPAPIDREPRKELPRNGNFLVLSQGEADDCRPAVAAALHNAGLQVRQSSLQQALELPLVEDLAGVVLILEKTEIPFYQLDPNDFRQRNEDLAVALFNLLRKLLPEILEQEDFRLLIMRPRAADESGGEIDGGAALLKSISLEHANPGFLWKWLSLPDGWTHALMADCLVRELSHAGERIEYHYNDAGERTSPTAMQFGESVRPAPRLGGTDTLLVSGGGKGITFELAYALAEKTHVKLGLLGSSPSPQDETDDGELAVNLRRLKGKGIRHLYLQADVTRADEVQQAVKLIERRLGRVSAILHGAGVSRFAEFQQMQEDDYLRCLAVKTTGLYNLLAAVPPSRLKALHVISSVLGRTGMHRQADYTYANAWLDGATHCVLRDHPTLHGFSLGYSVWEETGLGAKSGSLEMLKQIGVTPISTEQGVATYLDLATRQHPFSTFVQTGRLNETLEPRLMPQDPIPQWRFLERVRRCIPRVELIVEATLSHADDRYLPEHVFAGTPLMPTVMGLEAMVQTAQACLGTDRMPVIRQVDLKRPLIIREEEPTQVRVQALCDAPTEDGTSVSVRLSSDADGFAQAHFEIRCLFSTQQSTDEAVPSLPELPRVEYPMGPEDFSPSPLFQGKLLRRIRRIHKLTPFQESLTEMVAPSGARYYSSRFDQRTRTLSPAICDSMLQAAGLMAPPGYLPESVREIRSFRQLQEGESLMCWAQGRERSESSLTCDILLYDQERQPVHWIKDLVVKAPSSYVELNPRHRTKPLYPQDIQQSLHRLLDGTAPSLAMAHDEELLQQAAIELLPLEEREALLKDVASPRQTARLVNLLATRKSTIRYFEDARQPAIPPHHVHIRHRDDGKPYLILPGPTARAERMNISLADCNGISSAVVGTSPLGIDIERIEPRDAETWLGLLGDAGYTLALRLQRETGESFDSSATRVWTLAEAGRKAERPSGGVPCFDRLLDEHWASMNDPDTNGDRLLSALVEEQGERYALSLVIRQGTSSTRELRYG